MSTLTTEKPQTATITVRIDKDIKERAEQILADVGLTPTTAINSFYRKVISEDGVPYPLRTKRAYQPIDEASMSRDEILEMLSARLAQSDSEHTGSASEVFRELSKKHGINIQY